MIAAPGLFDMHAHARQPGREDAETFQTISNAAAKGGFTSIAVMLNFIGTGKQTLGEPSSSSKQYGGAKTSWQKFLEVEKDVPI